jgi:hypothetical protein
LIENIIFDERGYPYLTDFGVAHVQNDPWDKTLTCSLASGTKQYLAPEVFTKSHIHGPEVDYWSLGVVIYEVLFGRRPFEKHCPIPFIHYLEKALSLKRKYVKEIKMRELSQQSTDYSSPLPSPSPHLMNGMRQSFDFSSPSKQQQHSSALSKSFCQSRDHQQQQKLPLSPLKTGQSSEFSTSVDSKESLLFCNSAAGISPGSSIDFTASNHQFQQHGLTNNNNNKRSFNHGGFSNSFQEISLSAASTDKDKTTNGGSSADHTSADNSTNVSPNKNKMLKSKDSSNKFLPELKHGNSYNNGNYGNNNNNGNNPKTLFKRNPSIHPSAERGSFGGVGLGGMMILEESLGEQPYIAGDESEESYGSIEGHDGTIEYRALPGDHWLVDEGDLPSSLTVSIPLTNPWLGVLSSECIEVLYGLFDVRPSHRYGCRNLNKIRYSHWLESLKLTNWDDLGNKNYVPRFQPGKRFIKDTLNRIDDITQARMLGQRTKSNGELDGGAVGGGSIPMDKVDDLVTLEQEEMFKEFFHISRSFANANAGTTGTSSYASSATTITSGFSSKQNQQLQSQQHSHQQQQSSHRCKDKILL